MYVIVKIIEFSYMHDNFNWIIFPVCLILFCHNSPYLAIYLPFCGQIYPYLAISLIISQFWIYLPLYGSNQPGIFFFIFGQGHSPSNFHVYTLARLSMESLAGSYGHSLLGISRIAGIVLL